MVSTSREAQQITRRIKRLRQAVVGDNQAAFARLLGIEENRWNNIERGSGLSMKLAMLICKKTGVPVSWITHGDERFLAFVKDDAVRQRLLAEAAPSRRVTPADGVRVMSK